MKTITQPNGPERALTRADLLAALLALALMAALALPLLATTRHDSNRAGCLNNLRQMGRAAMMWTSEHGNRLSWHTPVMDGGLYNPGGTRPGNAWFEFAFMSNELATPRILACPADAGVLVAPNFPQFVLPAFRANALSYAINIHTTIDSRGAPLFLDRNFRAQPGFAQCFWRISPLVFNYSNDPNVGWTNAVHGPEGNHVTMDGAAITTTGTGLRDLLRFTDENGVLHFLPGRF